MTIFLSSCFHISPLWLPLFNWFGFAKFLCICISFKPIHVFVTDEEEIFLNLMICIFFRMSDYPVVELVLVMGSQPLLMALRGKNCFVRQCTESLGNPVLQDRISCWSQDCTCTKKCKCSFHATKLTNLMQCSLGGSRPEVRGAQYTHESLPPTETGRLSEP